MPVTAKISATTGLHVGDVAEYNVGGWRQPLSWQRRLQEWINASTAFDADIIINLGDLVDGNTTDSLKLDFLNGSTSFLSVATNAGTGFQAPRVDVLGNHIFPNWDGTGNKPDMQDYFDNIVGQTSGQTVTRSNQYNPVGGIEGETYGYTAEIDGIRYISTFVPRGGSWEANPDIATWLEARIAESTLPIVVLSHAHLWDDPNHPLASEWTIPEHATVMAMFDNYPLIQLVMGGHRHEHGWHYKRNGIHYLSTGGSTQIPFEGWVGENNNYILITMTTETIPTIFGMKADIVVAGTGIYGSKATQLTEVSGVM